MGFQHEQLMFRIYGLVKVLSAAFQSDPPGKPSGVNRNGRERGMEDLECDKSLAQEKLVVGVVL